MPLKKENFKMKGNDTYTGSLQYETKKQKKKKKDMFAGLNAQILQQFKKCNKNETSKKTKPAKQLSKKATKEISFKQQLHIHRALLQTPVAKKKTSQLATFLESM